MMAALNNSYNNDVAWVITSEDRAKHEAQFLMLNPVGGFLSGEQAKKFFLQSGLSNSVLGHIWKLSDLTADGRMDKKEFSIAMHLIKKSILRFQLPQTLPSTLLVDPPPLTSGPPLTLQPFAPHLSPNPTGCPVPSRPMVAMTTSMATGQFSMAHQFSSLRLPTSMPSMPSNASTLPAGVTLSSMTRESSVIPLPQKTKYSQLFNSHDRLHKGFLTGLEAKALLSQSGLPQPTLAQIWNLADVDKDGNLSLDEFCIAMHLSDVAKSGSTLPLVLPRELLPSAGQRTRHTSGPSTGLPSQSLSASTESYNRPTIVSVVVADKLEPVSNLAALDLYGHSMTSQTSDSCFSNMTFEDKRKENFERGQAELERRREMLRDLQRKEMEDRLAFEKSEQEKREKHRLEQELRKQKELEKQREKQRMLEAEKEEQRRKLIEQRETARQEMERQRQMEWQRQRRDQLMSEQKREQGHVDELKLEVGQLTLTLLALDDRKAELHAKIEQAKRNIADFTESIENMRVERDRTVSRNVQLSSDLERLSCDATSASEEKKLLDKKRTSLLPVQDENFLAVSSAYRQQKTSVEKLQTKLQKNEELKANIAKSIDSHGQQLQQLKSRMSVLLSENQRLKKSLSAKTAEFAKQKSKTTESQIHSRKTKEPSESSETTTVSDSLTESNDDPQRSSNAYNGFHKESWKDLKSETLSTSDEGSSSWASHFFSNVKPGSTSDSAMEQKLLRFTAIYQFDARSADELSLLVGDVILVSSDQSDAPDGWMGGKVGDREGLFPKDYVSLACDESTTSLSNSNKEAVENDGYHGKQSTIVSESVTNSDNQSVANSRSVLSVDDRVTTTSSPTPTLGQNAPEDLYVRAIYPWLAKKPYHLTFSKDDVIKVTVQQDNWWCGEFGGKAGWFPKTYVKVVDESETLQSTEDGQDGLNEKEVSSDSANHVNSGESSVPATAESDSNAEWYVALYPYTSSEPADLTFDAGEVIHVISTEGQWWKGILNGRMGDFPANYVAKYDANSNAGTANSSVIIAEQSQSPDPSPRSAAVVTQNNQRGRKPEIASVIASYEASGPEQLSLQIGQLINVRKKSPSGWWEGELQARGQRKRVGWFPADYVKLLGQNSPRSTPEATTPTTSKQFVKEARSNTPVVVVSAVEQVIALYDYQAQREDELSFFKGSVINVTSKDNMDWWQGEINGQTGLLPSNYVRPLSETADERRVGSQPDESQPRNAGALDLNSETEKVRQDHIQELITTEETYMKDLTTVIEVFYKPLLVNKVLTEEELNVIFINWREVKMCNMKLLKAMRVRKKMCGEGQRIHMIGDILCENLVHMSPYIRFCSCQLNSAALLQKKYETDSRFKETHKKCCMDSRTIGLPLSSFLLKPMQRITKYPLLIEKIFKHTPANHPDYHNLQEALSKATELCNQVNEGVREKENSDRLEWIQTRVHCDGLAEKITFNSLTNCLGPRKYIHNGVLYKVKSGKELVGILFNDFLLLAQPQRPIGNMTSIFTMDSKINFKMYRNPIFLNEVMVNKPQDNDSESSVFHISHVERTYVFRATTVNERDNWIRKIEAASKQYLETERKKKEKAHTAGKKTPAVGRLLVVIVEGSNLTAGEDGKSDPYCEVSMGVQEHKTKVVQNSLNPKWNASMQFTIKDLKEDVLCITVYDRDLFSPNDFLGRTEIRVCDILKETRATKGPIMKRLLLHEVESGEVIVKLDLQLFGTL